MRVSAVLVAVVSLLLSLFSLSAPEQSVSPTPVKVDFSRPVQTLYRIEVQSARSGWSLDAALAAGDTWAALGDSRRALAYWEIAFSLDGRRSQVVSRLAAAYWEQEQWSSALVMLKRLLTLDPADSTARLRLGLLQAIFDPQAAIPTLTDAGASAALLVVVPGEVSDVQRLMRVGATLAGEDDWAMAEAAFEYAASFSPTDGVATAYWGLARDRVGKDGSAQIATAVALLPTSAPVRYLQGLHLRLVGDVVGSLEALRTAAELDAANPAYAAELGAAYEVAGNLNAAKIWLRRAVALSADDERFTALLEAFYQRFPTLKE